MTTNGIKAYQVWFPSEIDRNSIRDLLIAGLRPAPEAAFRRGDTVFELVPASPRKGRCDGPGLRPCRIPLPFTGTGDPFSGSCDWRICAPERRRRRGLYSGLMSP
jgi:hypothetical protein